jgi:hypothetical protein
LTPIRWAIARGRVDHSGILLTVAELAVALAGFSSLVTVIGRRGAGNESNAIGLFRLQLVLENSLRNAASALLPLPFLAVAAHDPTMWRIASGLFLGSNILYTIITIGRSTAVGGRLEAQWEQRLLYSIWGVTSASAALDVANVVGLAGTHAFSLFLASLVLGLCCTGLMFLMVAIGVFRVDQS